MNLQITGIHLDITPAVREHVTSKMERATKNSDLVTSLNIALSVQKLVHKAEVTLHLRGKNFFVEAEDQDLYAAVDALADKVERQLVKFKEKKTDHGHDKIHNHLSQD